MSGRYSAHPDYQDSGLDWLGHIPKSWELRRLGSYFRERRTKVSDAEFSALSVTMQGIVPQLETAAKTNDGDNRKLVRAGDFVINSRSDRKGSSGVSSYDGSVSLISIVLEPLGIHPPFAHHLLRSSAFQEEFYRFGKGIVADLWSTNYAAMKNILIPVMSQAEQTQIAQFLDYETAKIDVLIEKQQQLIALLKEKRQAVVSHAVTKGLNPDVPMRDSGVEWLGEVPAHWEVGALSYALNAVGDVDHYMPPSVEKGVPYVMTGDLEELASEIDFTRCKQVAHHDYLRLCKKIKTTKGDLIMARYATIGTVSFVDLDSEFLVSYSCVTIKPNAEKALGRYLFFCLKSDSFVQGIQQRINTNTQGNVGIADLRKVKVALPAIEEQLKIAEYLQMRVAEMEKVLESSEATIDLLHERRTALISAAVTGKIDVRDWKAPQPEPGAEAA